MPKNINKQHYGRRRTYNYNNIALRDLSSVRIGQSYQQRSAGIGEVRGGGGYNGRYSVSYLQIV